jgi:hypothetical protein
VVLLLPGPALLARLLERLLLLLLLLAAAAAPRLARAGPAAARGA